MKTKTDATLLQMALVGYEAERLKIEMAMKNIQGALKLGGKAPGNTPAPRRKRKMSAAGRRRLVAAQKKRWAEFHAKAEKPARAKRKLSAAARAKLAANLAKARAAKAAKKAAAG